MDPSLTLIPITLFAMIGIVTCMTLWLLYLARRDHHETLRRSMELGQPLDPEVLRTFARPILDPAADFRSGLIAVCVGLAFFAIAWLNTATAGDLDATRVAAFLGILVIGFGIGLLIVSKIRLRAGAPEPKDKTP